MTPVELISPAAAVVEAMLNHKEEALALINRTTEIAPEGPHWGVELSWARTEVYALVGEEDRAISEIARLLRIPSWYSVHELKGIPPTLPCATTRDLRRCPTTH